MDDEAPLDPTHTSQVGAPTGHVKGSRRRARDRRAKIVYIAPAVCIVAAVLLYPLVHSLWISLSDVDPYTQVSTFVGLENYRSAISDPLFMTSLRNSVHFAGISIVGSTGLGLIIALILHQPSRLQGLARTTLIVPWALSQVVVAVIWGWIYSGSYGALNGLLSQAGLIDTYRNWFTSGPMALTLIAIAFVWNLSPYATLLFLAGLQTISPDVVEAASVDGAGPWQRFRYVTLPALRPSMVMALVVTSLEGFLAFTLIYVLTSGGPGNATSVLAWWGYTTTFQYDDVGKGAAILYLVSIVMIVASLGYMRLGSQGSRGGRRAKVVDTYTKAPR